MSRGLVIFAVVLAATPLVLQGHYLLGVSVLVGIFALATLGLDLLFGYSGQLSLGQAAFMGVGAYTSGLLTTRFHLPPLVAIVAGCVLAAALALAVGRPVLRLRGYYLVLATLTGGLIFEMLLVGWRDLTGGPSGLAGVPPFSLGGLVFTSDVHYHYLVWTLVLVAFVGLRFLTGGRIGRALRAVATDDVAASVFSIDVAKLKVQAFVISAILAAVAGSLFAHYTRFMSPDMVGMQTSFALVTMVALGGMGHLWGAILGTFLLKLLPELIGWMRDYQLIIHGLILMSLMIGMPRGIAGAVHNLMARKGGALHGGLAAGQRN